MSQVPAPGKGDAGSQFGKRAFGAAFAPNTDHPFSIQGSSNKLRAMASGTYNQQIRPNTSYANNTAFPLPSHAEKDIIPSASESTFGNTARYVDTPIPYPRMITNAEMFKMPGVDQYLFYKRTAAPSQRLVGHDVVGDIRALYGFSLEALNEFMFTVCHRVYNEHPDIYELLTPRIFWFGSNDAVFAPIQKDIGWANGGIIRLEEQLSGPSTRGSDGYGSSMMTISTKVFKPKNNTKVVSSVIAGPVQCQDIFGSRGTTIRSAHYLILTKVKMPTSPEGRVDMVLNSKAGVLNTGLNGVQVSHKIEMDMVKIRAKGGIFEHMKHPFRPLQLVPISVPDGGSPPPDLLTYEDEWGYKHYDAHAMCCASELFPAYQPTFRPTVETKESEGFTPYIDGRRGANRPQIHKTMVYPQREGAFAAL